MCWRCRKRRAVTTRGLAGGKRRVCQGCADLTDEITAETDARSWVKAHRRTVK